MKHQCDVCGGHGTYPIYNQRGHELYLIRCPECEGSGEALGESAIPAHIHGDKPGTSIAAPEIQAAAPSGKPE